MLYQIFKLHVYYYVFVIGQEIESLDHSTVNFYVASVRYSIKIIITSSKKFFQVLNSFQKLIKNS